MAGCAAGVVSGLPSSIHALTTGGRPIEATEAAGSILLPSESRTAPLVLAALPVHVALSIGWATVLALTLPRRATALWGLTAGAGIAALDLGLIGRKFARIRRLSFLPQLVDHLLFGWTVGVMVSRRRSARVD